MTDTLTELLTLAIEHKLRIEMQEFRDVLTVWIYHWVGDRRFLIEHVTLGDLADREFGRVFIERVKTRLRQELQLPL